MSADVLTLTPEIEVVRAIHLLLDRGVSGAPVIAADGTLSGIFTMRDGLAAALQATYWRDWGGSVADHMTPDPTTLDAQDDLIVAARAFVASAHRRFPVVREGRMVGVVSRVDVLGALVKGW